MPTNLSLIVLITCYLVGVPYGTPGDVGPFTGHVSPGGSTYHGYLVGVPYGTPGDVGPLTGHVSPGGSTYHGNLGPVQERKC